MSDYVGKTFLLGLSFADETGAVVEKVQVYGRAVRVTEAEGVVVRLDGDDEEYRLPKGVKILPAPKGEYVLLSSAEVITDPDYLAAWTIHPA
ncbi:MAG: hypothetical protein SF051_02115 [Elusimicrobiota bacterium]|nr:hypothetical protein [Elusimicrobiota bacterium]